MPERVAFSHLLMVSAALLAFALSISVLRDRTATSEVLVARNPIVPGALVSVENVDLVTIRANSPLAGLYLTPEDLAEPLVAASRVGRGEPLLVSGFVPVTNGQTRRSMSLPIGPESAAGFQVTVGDRVDVIQALGGLATFVAVDLEVVATARSDAENGLLGALAEPAETESYEVGNAHDQDENLRNRLGQTYYIVVAVDAEEALALAVALDSGSVSVLKSTGAPGAGVDGIAATDSFEPIGEEAGDGEAE